MPPKVKGYTDIYVILTYTGTETRVVWVIYTRNPLFRARVKIVFPPKGLNALHCICFQTMMMIGGGIVTRCSPGI